MVEAVSLQNAPKDSGKPRQTRARPREGPKGLGGSRQASGGRRKALGGLREALGARRRAPGGSREALGGLRRAIVRGVGRGHYSILQYSAMVYCTLTICYCSLL